jgi:proteasome lid subunit RPN8/RPN11
MFSDEVAGAVWDSIADADGKEICGFLLSRKGTDQLFFRLANIAEVPGAFLVGRWERERVKQFSDRHGYTIDAFVHSHRSGLELSAEDRRGLASSKIPWIVIGHTEEGMIARLYEPGK